MWCWQSGGLMKINMDSFFDLGTLNGDTFIEQFGSGQMLISYAIVCIY